MIASKSIWGGSKASGASRGLTSYLLDKQVTILKAERSVYAAAIDDVLLMTIGAGSFSPPDGSWKEEASGKRWRIWRKK